MVEIESDAIITINEKPSWMCVCKKCHRQFKSENELDTDGDGFCPEHQKEQENIARVINERIRARGPRSPSQLDAEEIRKHYRKEVDTQGKTFL